MGSNGASTLAVGFAFSTWANPDGSDVYPSYERVAEDLGLSARTISRAAQRLTTEGWLTVVRERQPPYQMVTRYRLSIPPKWRTDATAQSNGEIEKSGHPDAPGRSTRQQSPVTRSGTTTETTPGEPIQEYQDNPWFGLDDPAKPASTAVNTLRKSQEGAAPADPVWEWTDTELDWFEKKHRSGEQLWPHEQDALATQRPWLSLPPSFD